MIDQDADGKNTSGNDNSDTGRRRGDKGVIDKERYDSLLQSLQSLLGAITTYQPAELGAALLDELTEHLGADPRSANTVEQVVLPHRAVDYDIALQVVAERDPEARLVGLGGDQKSHMSLADMLIYSKHQRVPITQPEYVQLPSGPGQERSCLRTGLWLFRYGDVPVAVLARSAQPNYGRSQAALEILSLDVSLAGRLAAELDDIATQRSVLRGQVLTFEASPFERALSGVGFVARPEVSATAVVLPPGRLDRVRQHVVGIAEHRDALRAAGQHLKRGVLLYGPPGTGKTHTVRHLIGATPNHTVLLLAGQSLEFVSVAARIARALQPAMVVLEDCDLVAEDRHLFDGSKPLLFEVMDAMDGLDPDADVTFVLTTNRVEALERALAQRPGRVDLAVEIPLPDRAGRRQLLDLYAPAETFGLDTLDHVADQTEGATASLFKELVRRAVLAATMAGEPLGDAHLQHACDELIGDADQLSARLLGHRRPDTVDAGVGEGCTDHWDAETRDPDNWDADDLPGEDGPWPGGDGEPRDCAPRDNGQRA